MKKRTIASVLSVCMLFTAYACETETGEETQPVEVNVWTEGGTEKLLRDTDYSSRYGNGTLTIKAFRNEYESAQIMISGDSDQEYTVETAALKNAAGETLSKDAFALYHQKYISVTHIRDTNSPTSEGYYPDALIPMEKAVAYEENVTTGRNQGIWVTLNVPDDQPAGTYTGTFKVEVAGETYNVPVSVTVYDYTLSDEVHSKSSFSFGYEYLGWGELDTSVEMQEAYYEALLDYRLNAQQLPGNEMVYVLPEGEALERFLYYADKYTKDPRVSTFNLPFTMSTAVYEGKTINSVDFEQFAVLLREMATYSVENKVNLFEKASTYFIFFDEYDLNGTTDVANYNLNKGTEVCESVAAELAETLVCDDAEFLREMLDDLAGIKHKVVGSLTDGLQVKAATSVPLISRYETEAERQIYTDFAEECYGDDAELWCYTCLEPRTPHPTYHIEDILASSRLLSWMMYDYDIVGNLYWETALYTWREAAFGDYQLQDYYDTAMRYPLTNGDGFLFYPGRDYGVYGPIGTVRIHSIRDGNEDYDLLYALEDAYQNYGVSEENFNALYRYLTVDLYAGTRVRIRDGLTDHMAQSRESLAGLLELAYNAETVIETIQTIDGVTSVKLSAAAGVSLKANGETLTPTANGDRNEYAVSVPMTQTTNTLDVQATVDGKTYEMTLQLGGASATVNATSLLDKTTVRSGGEVTIDEIDGVQALKLAYEAADSLSAEMDVSVLNVTENKTTLIIHIYSYSDNAIDIKLLSKGANATRYITAMETTLQQGWNTIEIPVTVFNCTNNGTLTTLRINVDGTAATELAVGKIEVGG